VANVALPLAIDAEPSVDVPSLNVTVPLGLAPAIVAVRVTDCPKVEGLGLAASVVVLVAVLTVKDDAPDALVPLLPSPA
jgi:hypothetical protein